MGLVQVLSAVGNGAASLTEDVDVMRTLLPEVPLLVVPAAASFGYSRRIATKPRAWSAVRACGGRAERHIPTTLH